MAANGEGSILFSCTAPTICPAWSQNIPTAVITAAKRNGLPSRGWSGAREERTGRPLSETGSLRIGGSGGPLASVRCMTTGQDVLEHFHAYPLAPDWNRVRMVRMGAWHRGQRGTFTLARDAYSPDTSSSGWSARCSAVPCHGEAPRLPFRFIPHASYCFSALVSCHDHPAKARLDRRSPLGGVAPPSGSAFSGSEPDEDTPLEVVRGIVGFVASISTFPVAKYRYPARSSIVSSRCSSSATSRYPRARAVARASFPASSVTVVSAPASSSSVQTSRFALMARG